MSQAEIQNPNLLVILHLSSIHPKNISFKQICGHYHNKQPSLGAFHLVGPQFYMLSGPTHPLFECNMQWKCIEGLTIGAYILNGRSLKGSLFSACDVIAWARKVMHWTSTEEKLDMKVRIPLKPFNIEP